MGARLTAALAALLLFCLSSAVQAAGYTPQERQDLTLCATVALSIKSIAEYKVGGVPEAKTDRYFGHAPGQKENRLVKRVYADTVTDAWEYAAADFKSCALNKAKLPAERFAAAERCMRDAMIADSAISLRLLGRPRQDAYDYLKRFDDQEAHGAIDAAYAPPKVPKREDALDAWKACLKAGTG